MARAYSTTNQNLQNSISEWAYLEKSNDDLKVEGWGTTNIVYIGNESCESILLVGVDLRATSGGEEGSITDDKTQKYFFMESCNAFATKAGNSDHCKSMLNYVRNHFLDRKIVNGICEAPTIVKHYISNWETISNLELFQGFTTLAGYKDGIPYAYKVRASGKSSKKSKSNICHGHVMGSGGAYVREYFKNCNMEEAQSSNLI
ncbi:unnamed protein product [Prunus armeniaca]|uniref:Uncharacterized protein n=1 Tax=Prunus armeniaca TaxID=36596 RepID=A0A6J5UI05_PRUAR|nr:unnamed protein product [Prunus armeniaca]CAB4306442.1 unnamed protein product [Prunus armeniaca]